MTLSLHSAAWKCRQQQQWPTAPLLNLPLNQLPLEMKQELAKIMIAPDAPTGGDTDHLLPVIAFLKARGQQPATGDQFYFNRDGLGTYGFAEPLDVAVLAQHFAFPPSIKLSPGMLFDTRHFVQICQDDGPQPMQRLAIDTW